MNEIEGTDVDGFMSELSFKYCPACGGEMKNVRSNKKKCKECGTKYFWCNEVDNDRKLRVREIDRSKVKEQVKRDLVAMELKGNIGGVHVGR